jgi:D-alanyl-D-alanine carboxypeptidase
VLGGRSAGSRDQRMASLIDTYTERAYAGARTAPAVAEKVQVATTSSSTPVTLSQLAALSEAAPPVEKQREQKLQRIALAEEDTTTTAAVMPPVKSQAKVLDLSAARPVVASVAGGSTTTPGSGTAMRWNVGPQAVVRTETKLARLDTPSVITDEKAELRAEKSIVPKSASSGWIIQLGATDDEAKAREILQRAKASGKGRLARAEGFTEKVSKGGSTLYRARFSGFDENDAQSACKVLKRDGFSCFTMRGG